MEQKTEVKNKTMYKELISRMDGWRNRRQWVLQKQLSS